MTDDRIALTFYHSAVCPRCFFAGRALAAVLQDFPSVELTKVELLTHRDQARKDKITLVPALVAGEQRLAGFVLTRSRIRHFLEALTAASVG